jgi:hypothetical protein
MAASKRAVMTVVHINAEVRLAWRCGWERGTGNTAG